MSEAAPAGSSRRSTAFVPHDLKAPVIGGDAGPLAGFTVAVKDMYDIAGERTGGGNPQWLEAHEPAGGTAAAVRALLDAGATVIGKTVCDEFFFSITGANAHYGTPVNPRAPGRLPGGSSSGSAAATAAGACDIGLGSDTGGSVRVPAALCGIYAIRPTHGRVSLAGAMGMAPTFDTAGWFAAAPDLLRKVGPVLLDAASARGLVRRLLMPTDAFAEADADVVAVLDDFLSRAATELPKSQQVTVAPDASRPCATASAPSKATRSGASTAAGSDATGRRSAPASRNAWPMPRAYRRRRPTPPGRSWRACVAGSAG